MSSSAKCANISATWTRRNRQRCIATAAIERASRQASSYKRDLAVCSISPEAGVLGSVLSWLTFYFSNKPIGASSFYAHIAGSIGKRFSNRHAESLTYFNDNPPRVNWGLVFVVATIVGGAIAALTGGEFTHERLPPMWEERFGESITLRAVIGFVGGVFMAFGARLAGGCTSGHGISGTMQLNPGSWITVICLFIGGVVVAKFNVLIGQLLLPDFTVAKIMLTAIIVGMIGVFTPHHFGKIELHIKPTRIGANLIGGLVFGAGFALLGYCPGTGAAALGQGSWDVLFGIAGLVAGSY